MRPTTSKTVFPLKYKPKELSIELLKRNESFIAAISTPVGSEILKDLIDTHAHLLVRLSSLDVTDEEKIKFRLLNELIERWSVKIEQYNKAKEILRKEEDE